MSWTTASADLRSKLSDGSTDKLRAFKRVLGKIDGSNKRFKTFEFRRLTDFTSAADPFGVYKNDVLLSTGAFTSDTPSTGYFVLTTAPVDGDVLESTYNIQWFLDSELDIFLRTASNWLGGGDDYSNLDNGLRPSALNYASAEAYQKLALRFAEHISETYRMEDSPDEKRMEIVKAYESTAEKFRDEARKLRDDYYTRQGQSLAPNFGVSVGNFRDVPPRR